MSKTKSHIELRGAELLTALAASTLDVKCLRHGAPYRILSPDAAIKLVRSGVFVGKVRKDKKRVHSIREIDPRYVLDDSSYWDGRSVIRFHNSQLTEAPSRKHKRILSMWNRFLKIPNPRNWTPPSIVS